MRFLVAWLMTKAPTFGPYNKLEVPIANATLLGKAIRNA